MSLIAVSYIFVVAIIYYFFLTYRHLDVLHCTLYIRSKCTCDPNQICLFITYAGTGLLHLGVVLISFLSFFSSFFRRSNNIHLYCK